MSLTKTILLHLIIALPAGSTVHSQEPDLKFEHLTVENGLSSNTVYSILQDSRGFMWFGTSEGLNRYDGYSFKAYRHDPGDSTSISDNFIWFESLSEDQKGLIWIGTKDAGLNRFNPITETFSRFQHDPHDTTSLSSNNSLTLWVDNAGVLWVGTDKGLNRFDHVKETFERFQHDPGDPTSLVSDRIWRIYGTGYGSEAELWIATYNGLDRFNRETRTFEHIGLDGLDPNNLYTGPITDIYDDQRGTLWLGSAFGLVKLDLQSMATKFYRHDAENSNSLNFPLVTSVWQDPGTNGRVLWITTRRGLNRFDTEAETFDHYAYDPAKPDGLNAISVIGLYEDRYQRLWIGSHSHGINKLNPPIQNFELVKHDPSNQNSLLGWQVRAIHEDRSGALWLGTEYGLNKWDRESGLFTRFTFDSDTTGVVGANVISGIAEDDHGILWLGTRGGGLVKFDPLTGGFRQYRHEPVTPSSLASDEIGRVYFDSFGALWLGTTGQVVSRLLPEDREVGRFTHFKLQPEDKTGFNHQKGFTFLEDTHGDFWIGSHLTGLYRFDQEAEQFTQYRHAANDPNSLSSNVVNGIYETCTTQDTLMWVATDNALNRFDRRSQSFRRFYNKQPGGSDFIFSITGDAHNHLWMENQKGISKFDTQGETFINFAGSRGLPADMSNDYGYHRTDKGEILFGGMGGLIHFHPDSILGNQNIPPIVLTDFKVFNEPAELDSSITVKKRIDLAHDQNFFSFEFAVLDYTDPKKNQYAYMLEGLDSDWVYGGNRRFANYTSVPPGNYIFRVKGSNNDGIWNDKGASLTININPPWWRTGWAYTGYVALFALALYGLRRFELKRAQLRHQLKIKTFESEKLRELDGMKSRFFANISHEFRTPLTLILGPLGGVVQKIQDGDIRQDLSVIRRNAQRLQRLIDQLLDLSKLDAKRMPLRVKLDNLVIKMRELVAAFASLAESRDIRLELEVEDPSIEVYFDAEKLEKIVSNLLSNALKFTPEAGEVNVTVRRIDSANEDTKSPGPARFAEIKVADSGCGIARERVERIFDRFYQVDDGLTRRHAGTGIGLALTKELVELHHGEIRVQSELGVGSAFTVLLPLGRDHFTDDEVLARTSISEADGTAPEARQPLDVLSDSRPVRPATPARTGQPLVLIVEDNDDMRHYLSQCFVEDYAIAEADSGESGIQMALQKVPDLIVSDVMMAKMDGLAMCEKLKSDQRTSHIPVILLTARASKASKVEGFETGADDYIIKPFDTEELRIRAKNLIEQRVKLRERFQREVVMKPGQITTPSWEDKFLQKAMSIVQERLADPDFGAATLARELGMSRVQLHRKLDALTGLSASRFIRTLRLKRAVELLKSRAGNIAEIVYEVGFNNIPYFNKCFREQFGEPPSRFISKLSPSASREN